jgi:uncharacterized protein (TIGR03435 family)
MRKIAYVALFLSGLPSSFASAQQAPRPEFEAASIKPNNGVTNFAGMRLLPGGRIEAQNVNLKFLIQNAYKVKPFQIVGGPSWIESQRYDVSAKPEEGASQNQVSLMMQSLLADRFKLRLHRETRETQVYLLTPAKGGMKLPEAKPGSCITPNQNAPMRFSPDGPRPCGSMMMSPGAVNGASIGMDRLTDALSNLSGRTVIDKTGFTGTFDVHLEFTPEGLPAGPFGGLPPPPDAPKPPANDANAPSIFTALQEQLGLRLESAKDKVEILVIDSAEKPSEN